MVDRIKNTVEIHASARKCYERFMNFETYPRFMNRVKSVSAKGENLWQWVITTPMAQDITCDVVIDMDDRNRRVTWHTVNTQQLLRGSKNKINKAQGTVRFDEVAPNRTEVTCAIQFEMVGRPLAEALTELIIHPQSMLEEEMRHFKDWVEGTNEPAAKATVGKTLAGSNVPAATSLHLEEGYEGPFDLDEIEAQGQEVIEDADPVIRELLHEENPYLGEDGALESEDAWPDKERSPFEFDVFSESLDVPSEDDLVNYTEDMDDDALDRYTGQTMADYEMMLEDMTQVQPPPSRAARSESEL